MGMTNPKFMSTVAALDDHVEGRIREAARNYQA
jgi:hypothetical protein